MYSDSRFSLGGSASRGKFVLLAHVYHRCLPCLSCSEASPRVASCPRSSRGHGVPDWPRPFPAIEVMQPPASLAEAAKWKEMKAGDRRIRDRGRGPQTAQDVVGPGINQEPTEAADVLAQRPQRVADAAAQSKLEQGCWRGGAGETDMNGNVETARLEFPEPSENGGALEAELGNEVDANAHPSSPITLGRERHHRLFGAELRMAFRMSREADGVDAVRLYRAARTDVRTGFERAQCAQRIACDHQNAVRFGFAARPRQKVIERVTRSHLARRDMQDRIESQSAQRGRRFDVVAIVITWQERDRHVDARAEMVAQFRQLVAARRDLDRSGRQQSTKIAGRSMFRFGHAGLQALRRAKCVGAKSRMSRR